MAQQTTSYEVTHQEPMDIDELMDKIRQEAAFHHAGNSQTSPGAGGLPQPRPAKTTKFKRSAWFHYKDFIGFQGNDFIRAVFIGLLGREPEAAALNAYQKYLKRGGSKLSILAEVRLSPEGLQRNLALTGMAPVLLRHRIFRRIGLPGRVLRRLCDLLDRVFLFFVTPGLTLSDLKSVDDGRVQSQQSLVDSLQALVHRQDSIIDELQARLSDENRFTRDALAGIGEHLKKLEQRLDHYPRELTDTLEQAEAEQMGRMNQALADVSQLRQQFGYYQRSHQLALESLDKLAASDHPLHGTEALRSEVEKQKEAQLDAYYVAFEDACRGSRKEIKAGLQHYSPLFKELQGRKLLAEKPVVDLGCGRGEWLELLEEWGWQALGIDLNQIMVEVCGEFGLKAQCQDALQYLKSLPDNSLAAITGFHIIEHLPFDLLHGLFNESMRVIRGGGIILFETPNPENVLVGSHTFYHDFTHRNPITPSSITFLAEYFGFTEIEIIRSHPYPEDARVPGNDPLTERVNGHLCGPQDFAILARKPLIDKSGRLLNV